MFKFWPLLGMNRKMSPNILILAYTPDGAKQNVAIHDGAISGTITTHKI